MNWLYHRTGKLYWVCGGSGPENRSQQHCFASHRRGQRKNELTQSHQGELWTFGCLLWPILTTACMEIINAQRDGTGKGQQLWLLSHTSFPKHLPLTRLDTLVCTQKHTVMRFLNSRSNLPQQDRIDLLFAVNTLNIKCEANEWMVRGQGFECGFRKGKFLFKYACKNTSKLKTVQLVPQFVWKLPLKPPSSLSLSPRALLWWVSQHEEPDTNTWSGSKASCSYPAPPAGRSSFTTEWKMRRQDGKDRNKRCPTGSSRFVMSREPAGSARRCTVSLRWHREGTTGIHLKISLTKKVKIRTLSIEQLRDVLVWEKVLFVCRVPLGPKCVKSHVRQYEAAQHLPQALASSIFLRLTTEQSHSSSLRRHSDPSHFDIHRELCLEAAGGWNSADGLHSHVNNYKENMNII